MKHTHDRSYHLLFSEPALLEDLIRNFVDEPWVADLDFARMERINTKFHSNALERRDGGGTQRINRTQTKHAAVEISACHAVLLG